jgi:hypothetical protein
MNAKANTLNFHPSLFQKISGLSGIKFRFVRPSGCLALFLDTMMHTTNKIEKAHCR